MLATRCFCNKLRRSARVLTQLYDEALAPAELKVTQFVLLRSVERTGPTSITDLADMVALDRSTLGRNARVLAQQGLVKLGDGDDQRMQIISLTAAGKKAIARALPLWEHVQKRLSTQFNAEEKNQLFALLDKIEQLK